MPTLMRMDAENFVALKRRFYFDHSQGQEAFFLAGERGKAFIDVLQENKAIEEKFKHSIIESINLAYCPVLRPKMTTRLFLWIGHRYHEQPSHGYIANQSIADSELELLRPRLPSRMTGAFHYQPDHLLLRYKCKDKQEIVIKIDYNLFVALEKLRQELPRQLLPDREVNRLEDRAAGSPFKPVASGNSRSIGAPKHSSSRRQEEFDSKKQILFLKAPKSTAPPPPPPAEIDEAS